jgi:hypothetical protein
MWPSPVAATGLRMLGRMSATDAAAMGMRRGRSAYSVGELPADDGIALERRHARSRATSGDDFSAPSSRPASSGEAPQVDGDDGVEISESEGGCANGEVRVSLWPFSAVRCCDGFETGAVCMQVCSDDGLDKWERIRSSRAFLQVDVSRGHAGSH